MKKTFSLMLALLGLALATSAQNRTIDIRPAHDGQDFTMQDAVLGWQFYPQYQFPAEARPAIALDERPWRPFTEGNSLYVTDGTDTLTVAESHDREMVYGQSVSRNEFGINEGWYLSPTGLKLAFFRKDESRVTDFPLLDIRTRTGSLKAIKYPMNGMDSEFVELGIFDIQRGSTVYLDVRDFTPERYLTGITWSPDERRIYVQVLDRSQHRMHLNAYDAATGRYLRTLLTEENDAWVEPQDPLYFLKGRTDLFLYRTDNRDGYKNLYLADTLGTVRRLTAVDADVEYVGNDGRWVYYTSAEISPVENHLFRMEIKLPKRKVSVSGAKFGKPVNLTPERGWHNPFMNAELTEIYDTYSNVNTPGVALRRKADGTLLETIATVDDPLADYASCEVELGTIPSADGKYENYYRLIKPKDFDPSRKYPVILYVYGGPHTQLVRDTWLAEIRLWEMLMAQKGYVVYIQDNRGTPNRGAAYEKAINRRCGVAEMEDQMVGIDWLRSQPWVDASRIGVHGWSYGGFMTISLMTTYPDVFKVGVAGGPVIDWKWYEIMYGERYMDNPETNPDGFAETSLIHKASHLLGKLLICQGAVDNTCVWEHSLSFVQACIEANVQVDYFPYPLAEHNVHGVHRVHLMDKVTDYFDAWL